MNAHAPAPVPPVDRPLRRQDRDGVAILTLDRPEARNALSDAMLAALGQELEALRSDRSVKAVVVAANGPAFSSGHDLKEVTAARAATDRGAAAFEDLVARCTAVMTGIVRLPQPVIAAVEGVASAAGCQLVASCDLAIAGAAARFCTPGVNIGLFCSTPMVALSRNVAPKHAMEMLLLGDMVPAADAARIGLVNRVVPAGSALVEALRLADAIAAKSAATVKLGKAAFYAQLPMSLDGAYAHTGRVILGNLLAASAVEGIGAFVAKRAPVWPDP